MNINSACTGHRTYTSQSSLTPTALVSIGRAPKRPEGIYVAAQHNLREGSESFLERESVRHPDRPPFVVLEGPHQATAVAEVARQKLQAAGIQKVRSNAVRAIEVIISLSPSHGIDDIDFFRASARWFAKRFGGDSNLISAVVHYDENNDHLHLLIQPVVDGRLIGSQLIGMGGRFKAHQADFDEEVARPRGVKVLMPLALGRRGLVLASRAVVETLVQMDDALLHSSVFRVVKNSIERQPIPFLSALGIDIADFVGSHPGRTCGNENLQS